MNSNDFNIFLFIDEFNNLSFFFPPWTELRHGYYQRLQQFHDMLQQFRDNILLLMYDLKSVVKYLNSFLNINQFTLKINNEKCIWERKQETNALK